MSAPSRIPPTSSSTQCHVGYRLPRPPRCLGSCLALASSSRSRIAVRTGRAAVRLIWERPSVNVRQPLVMNVPIVSQLVTRLASKSVRGLVHAWSSVK